MNPLLSKLTVSCTLLLGIGLWSGMAQKFDAQSKLSYEPNVGCIKGSPYGKIAALAMQGPIDFYWHKGKTHEDEIILAADNGHDHGEGHKHGAHCADGCEDHADHHQDQVSHQEQVSQQAEHDHGAHQHGEDCGCSAHDEADQLVAGQNEPFHIRAKMQIKKMAAAAHRKTDGKPLSPAHQQYLQGVTEDKLRLAYELDPANYTNYGNYHLFIATTSFGRSDADASAAVELAQRTLEFCKKDKNDPASWVTAAGAAYNIIYHIGTYYEEYSIAEAKGSLAEFDHCMSEYVRLRDLSLEDGRILSRERLDEMEARIKYLNKLRRAQGEYMKRVMTTKMAHMMNEHHRTH